MPLVVTSEEPNQMLVMTMLVEFASHHSSDVKVPAFDL